MACGSEESALKSREEETGAARGGPDTMIAVVNVAFNVVAPIFLVVGLAALVTHRYKPDPGTLSSLTTYLFSPCLVLDGMVNSDLRADEIGQLIALVLLLAIVLAGIGWGVSRLLGFDRRLESAFLLTVVLANAGNYGLPLNEFAFGEAGLQRATVFFVTSALVVNTAGVFLASRGSVPVRQSLRNVLKVPLGYAMALGLLLNFADVTLPLPVQRTVAVLGQAAVPGMLAVLGMQLARVSVKGQVGPMLLATGLRLILAPALAFGLALLLGLGGVARQVAVVEAGMPAAVFGTVLATEFGSDAEFTTAVIMVSTLASLVTLSVLLVIIG